MGWEKVLAALVEVGDQWVAVVVLQATAAQLSVCWREEVQSLLPGMHRRAGDAGSLWVMRAGDVWSLWVMRAGDAGGLWVMRARDGGGLWVMRTGPRRGGTTEGLGRVVVVELRVGGFLSG